MKKDKKKLEKLKLIISLEKIEQIEKDVISI